MRRGLLLIVVGAVLSSLVNADESALRLRPPDSKVAGPAAHATPSPAPPPRNPVKVVTSSLAIVLGGIALLLIIFRKSSYDPAPAMMDTLGKVRVTPRVELHLVRIGNRILVLHVAPNSVQRVAEIADPDEVRMLLLNHRGNASELLSARVGDLLAKSAATTGSFPSEPASR